jgi:CheY-like chemotaxis protein
VPSDVSQSIILVVEDNDAVRRVIVPYIEHAGYRPLAAGHGTGARSIVTASAIDPVVSDSVMPEPPVRKWSRISAVATGTCGCC